ncbi:MAG: homoserine O-succinyltransferase [Brevundimonas sp.]|uniref:homoserine O-succinyltransferase MetX n=1 Tax=Brevundimonas sp. TaxID=1871086 RepID=UPI00271D1046|nr:homoserine O-succinyltransferase [Brevundimonas sp.]MDO9077325.1 homoserine O-succinyltransferase [Brevundimonas sp.]MDP3081188.1 homoserine O-succinyltransferase [Brevundimonas sp.]MDZ4113130.1 homoserine O-succinyltransferase [Brevundimonas sp.]
MASIDIPEETAGRDIHAAIPDDFRLESGQHLGATEVVGRLFGPGHAPLVVVAGGISSGRFATRWWPSVVRTGGPVDVNRLRILALDLLPGRDEPGITITTADQARLLALLLDALGEKRIDAFVGASYGGCIGLAFAALYPERIGELTVISAAHRAHPAATAVRGVQRRLLAFARDCGREAEGVALARQLAMTTYRTAEEFDLRFSQTPPPAAGDAWPVCDYLIARGSAYAGATSADRWISLSDSLDRHSIDPRAVRCPLTVVGFSSDTLVPIADSRELAARAPNLRRLVEAPSIFGHDAFLKERELIGRVLHDVLNPLTALQPSEIAA